MSNHLQNNLTSMATYHSVEADRKDIEKERRKIRMIQVREESKKIAKNIRTKVAAEKKKHLTGLEQEKLKELELWRQKALSKKFKDYRSSIFQIGTAHKAAIDEKVKNEKEKNISLSKDGKKGKKPNYLQNVKGFTKGENKQSTYNKTEDISFLHNSKKDVETKKNINFCLLENCINNKCECFDTSPMRRLENSTETKSNPLQKTPVVVDTDLQDCENASISDFDVDDFHVQNNRKFTRVVSLTPNKRVIPKVNMESKKVELQSDIKTLDRATKKPNPVSTSNKSEISTSFVTKTPGSSNIGRKRISAISDFLKKIDEKKEEEKKNRNIMKPDILDAENEEATETVNLENIYCRQKTKVQNQFDEFISNTESLLNEDKPENKINSTEVKKKINQCNNNLHNEIYKKNSAVISLKKNGETSFPEKNVNWSSINKQRVGLYDDSTMNKQTIKNFSEKTKIKSNFSIAEKIKKKNSGTKTAIESINTLRKRNELNGKAASISGSEDDNTIGKKKSSGSLLTVQAKSSGTVIREIFQKKPISSSNEADKDLVHYFDYNNKYEKSYKPPINLISLEKNDEHALTAIELAEKEKSDALRKNLSNEKVRQAMLERSNRAFEREQLKRECNEFTEKLDNLLKQYPKLLTKDEDFVDSDENVFKIRESEQNLNTMVEEILLKPAIITCPYVNETSEKKSYERTGNDIAAFDYKQSPSYPSRTSSCASLLGIVNDQTIELQKSLRINQNNPKKIEQLKKLIIRVDQIRLALMEEIKREDLLKKTNVEKSKCSDVLRKVDFKQKSQNAECQEKNYLTKVSKQSGTEKENKCGEHLISMTRKDDQMELPLEIIIKVQKGEIVDVQKSTSTNFQKLLPKNKPEQIIYQSLISYDSNSTAYRSLPENRNHEYCSNHNDKEHDRKCEKCKHIFNNDTSVHPLVKHYVQRLLVMNRESVRSLCVSSSDIETPNSSIMNTTSNKMEDGIVSEAKLQRVEEFISENRNLINKLESGLTSQNCLSAEQSIKLFDEILQNQFEKSSKSVQRNKPKFSKSDMQNQPTPILNKKNDKTTFTETKQYSNDWKGELAKKSEKNSFKAANIRNEEERASKNYQVKEKNEFENYKNSCPEAQIERYAELTDNCTQRIKELTDLITQVRKEKKKLLEVTLSSASETGRNSTEYYELPSDPMSKGHSLKVTTKNQASNISNCSTSSSLSSAEQLQTNLSDCDKSQSVMSSKRDLKTRSQICTSLDSGISGSRPVTVLGNEGDNIQLNCINIQNKADNNVAKSKPPPTMKRFSPLMIEGEKVHELSTITEVDTPATSRLNTEHFCGLENESTKKILRDHKIISPEKFPTFEQYIKECAIPLDILGEEESLRLREEFEDYLMDVNKAREKDLYRETFPNLSSYIENHCAGLASNNIEEQMNEIVCRLRKELIKVRSFPDKDEYLKRCHDPKIINNELLDSDSLENINDNILTIIGHSESSSDPLDIENELRKRNLLKKSFRRNEKDDIKSKNFAESTRKEQDHLDNSLATENGFEQFSFSNSLPSSLKRRKKLLGLDRSKNCDTNNTSSTDTIPTPSVSKEMNAIRNQSCNESGQPLNLRDFISQELNKYAHSSASTTSFSDGSIRNFLFNPLQTNLNSNILQGSHGGTVATIDRQKTSTPVGSTGSVSHSAETSTNLFSGASHLSSVHYDVTDARKICKKCHKKCSCN